jgi:hypothetical protein
MSSVATAAGVSLAELDVQVITAPSLRLDLEADRIRLEEGVVQTRVIRTARLTAGGQMMPS